MICSSFSDPLVDLFACNRSVRTVVAANDLVGVQSEEAIYPSIAPIVPIRVITATIVSKDPPMIAIQL